MKFGSYFQLKKVEAPGMDPALGYVLVVLYHRGRFKGGLGTNSYS
jgi:hypothetical protein